MVDAAVTPGDGGARDFTLKIKRRGDIKALHALGPCRSGREGSTRGLSCNVESDGGGVYVEREESEPSSRGQGSTNGAGRATRKSEREEFTVPGVRDLEMNLQRTLGTQVRVRMKPDHTGEVAIEFYTLEDLERLQELIATISTE